MVEFTNNKIETLSDVFAVWIGKYPEDNASVRIFLQDNKLDKLLGIDDVNVILYHNGYLSDKTRQAVYALMPPILKVQGREYALFAQTFNRLNKKAEANVHGKIVDAPIVESVRIIRKFFDNKIKYMKDNLTVLKAKNDKFRNPNLAKEAYERRKRNMSEEDKLRLREKAKLNMRKYREEHPKSVIIQNYKSKKSQTLLQKLQELLIARARNKKYREENYEKCLEKNRRYREKEKQENPQRVKDRNSAYRKSEAGKASSRRYYEKHKEEIARKAKENCKTAIYKQRYKRKIRLKKTGPILASLLQAIRLSKSR